MTQDTAPKQWIPDRLGLALGVGLVLALASLWWQPWNRGYSLPSISAEAQMLIEAAPIILALFGAIIAVWFTQSRVLFALIILGLAQLAMVTLLDQGPRAVASEEILYGGIALMAPPLLAILSSLKDGPIRSLAGGVKLCFVVALSLGLMAIAYPQAFGLSPDHSEALQSRALMTLYSHPLRVTWGPLTPVPQPAFITLFMSFGILVWQAVRDQGASGLGLFMAVIGLGACLHWAGQSYLPSLAMTLAVFALFLALLQDAYRLAYIDELTGLPGRRALDQTLGHLQGPFVMAMVDIDHFKAFNDTHGHDVGDQVLKMVAGRLATVTGGGKAFRYGGEEFSIVFPSKTLDEAGAHLEYLRLHVADRPFRIRDQSRPKKTDQGLDKRGAGTAKGLESLVSVTVSIGYAAREDQKTPASAVIKQADEALYRAKDGGRNRVSR